MIRRRVLALALVAFTGEALQAPSTGKLIHRHLETSATSKVQTPRVDLSKHVQPTAAENVCWLPASRAWRRSEFRRENQNSHTPEKVPRGNGVL